MKLPTKAAHSFLHFRLTTNSTASPDDQSYSLRRRRRLLCGLDRHRILSAHEAAGIRTGHDVREGDIALDGAKERDPGSDEHGNACDDEPPDEPGLKKPLNGDPAIHVDVPDATS